MNILKRVAYCGAQMGRRKIMAHINTHTANALARSAIFAFADPIDPINQTATQQPIILNAQTIMYVSAEYLQFTTEVTYDRIQNCKLMFITDGNLLQEDAKCKLVHPCKRKLCNGSCHVRVMKFESEPEW